MKTLKPVLVLLIFFLSISCSKDEEPKKNEYVEENYFTEYLRQSGFDTHISPRINFGQNHEDGIEFIPLVKGVITGLQVRLPGANPTLRVTIWEKYSKAIVKTEYVNVEFANTSYIFDIEDIPLTKNKEYAITFNANDYYSRTGANDAEANYPITAGNIQISAYIFGEGTSQTYPKYSVTRSYAGDLSFNFLQIE